MRPRVAAAESPPDERRRRRSGRFELRSHDADLQAPVPRLRQVHLAGCGPLPVLRPHRPLRRRPLPGLQRRDRRPVLDRLPEMRRTPQGGGGGDAGKPSGRGRNASAALDCANATGPGANATGPGANATRHDPGSADASSSAGLSPRAPCLGADGRLYRLRRCARPRRSLLRDLRHARGLIRHARRPATDPPAATPRPADRGCCQPAA
jgi:hypothetical protein